MNMLEDQSISGSTVKNKPRSLAFVVTGANDAPVLTFTSVEVARQFCINNWDPRGRTIYSAELVERWIEPVEELVGA
jgi:hypothetical protein